LCLGLLMGLSSSAPAHAVDVSVASTGISVSSDANGAVTVLDASGQPLLRIGDYTLAWSPGQTAGGIPIRFTTADGQAGLQVDYHVSNDASGTLRIRAQFVPKGQCLHLHYDVWASDTLNPGGAMLGLESVGATGHSVVRLGQWQRDAGGGVPFEVPDVAGLFFRWPGETALVNLAGANTLWQGENSTNFPAKGSEPGHFVAEGQIALTPMAARPPAAAALLDGRTLALDLWTDHPFNVWDSGNSPLALQVETANLAAKTRPVKLTWWARDFQGQVVSGGHETRKIGAGAVWDEAIPVPSQGRNLLFVEVQARCGSESVFSRTNLAVIGPHQFLPAEGSLFGISAFFPQPTRDDALAMLQRIGVRWLRGNDRADWITPALLSKYGMRQDFAAGFVPTDTSFSASPDHTRDWLTQQFQSAKRQDAPFWEIGNEWNMVGGLGKAAYATEYAQAVLSAADQVRHATNSPVKIMTQGLAGPDLAFIDALYNAGAWDHFDAFGFHPGRGNVTPDDEGLPAAPGQDGPFWTFLGSIRKVKARLARYGDKPLFITEAYACTQENTVWFDTYRHGAENVVLSYALAKAEGVQQMDWYQFNDGVWYNPGGVSATDSEYHYGLVNRDLSPKPSLLAYRTIAVALDGAQFVRWLHFGDPNNRGLLFDTPKGLMAILWNRADGTTLNRNHAPGAKRFAAPEAWADDWPTKTTVVLNATAPPVREVDCIGQERILTVTSGKVRIVLDGAPRLYYGLAVENGR